MDGNISTANMSPGVQIPQARAYRPKLTGGNGPTWNSTPQFITPSHSNIGQGQIPYAQNKTITPQEKGKHKMIEPETFDGTSDWMEYIIHFEMISSWKSWTPKEMTTMLKVKLRGNAAALLTTMSYNQFTDSQTLKQTLGQRFKPQKREIAYRCEFRSRRRIKGENPNDFRYVLRRLAQKAYPSVILSALEVHVLDQFIEGIGSVELQKHI